jgi:hypothetical protein
MAVDAPECDILICTDKTGQSAMRFAVVFIRVDAPECDKHRKAQQATLQHANT